MKVTERSDARGCHRCAESRPKSASVTGAGSTGIGPVQMADWIDSLEPVAPTTVFFKDSGFENDQAKTNVAAILEQRLGDQLLKVRSV